MIVWLRPNLLLLDEPTNHLDLATREALSVALNEFEGSVMLVSHDRALLRVCDEFWMVSRGGVSDFDGDLDDYQVYCWQKPSAAAKRRRANARRQHKQPWQLARYRAIAMTHAYEPESRHGNHQGPPDQSARAFAGMAPSQ
jgi:ABC-type sulfate/molybdate transport systems ATPase subunit